MDVLTRAGSGSPALWRRHPSRAESGGLGAAARQPPELGAPEFKVTVHRPQRSRPRSASRTPPPARCRPGNSVFRRFRTRVAGRTTGPRNFPKWRERRRVRRPPAPLSLPPHRRPRCSGRPALGGAPRGHRTSRVPAAVGPGPSPRALRPRRPSRRGPRPHPRTHGGAGRRRHSPHRACRRAGRAPRPTLTRHSTRRLARRARRPLSPKLLVTRSERRNLRRRRGRRCASSGPAAASPRACAQRPLPTNDRKNHRGRPGAREEGLGEQDHREGRQSAALSRSPPAES